MNRFHPPAKPDDSDDEDEGKDRPSSTQWSANPMTDGSDYPNSQNVEMTDVGNHKSEAVAKKKKRRKKKAPVRTDPNTIMNPLVFKMKH